MQGSGPTRASESGTTPMPRITFGITFGTTLRIKTTKPCVWCSVSQLSTPQTQDLPVLRLTQNIMDPATTQTSTPTRIELWALADTVRRKLLNESSKPDPPLRVLVGHANMLDRLIGEIYKHDAEEDSVGELDFGTGTVEAVALSPTDSDSDSSTDSDSETESEDSDSYDEGGVECSGSGCCQPEPMPEGRDEWLGTGSAEAQEDHWTPSVPEHVSYHW